MEIYKNKSSGKNFIYLVDTGSNEALFVTPQNETKPLKTSLFNKPENEDADYLLSHGLITKAQAERFREYEKNRSEDAVETFEYLFDQLSPYQRSKVIEAIQKGKI
jgi:hypothetical protein